MTNDSAKREANTNLFPMLGENDVSIDIRVGDRKHMTFVKADPIAIATFLKDADDDFRHSFLKAAKRYMPELFDGKA